MITCTPVPCGCVKVYGRAFVNWARAKNHFMDSRDWVLSSSTYMMAYNIRHECYGSARYVPKFILLYLVSVNLNK